MCLERLRTQARGNLEGHGSRTSGNCLHVSSVSFLAVLFLQAYNHRLYQIKHLLSFEISNEKMF